MRAQEVFGPKEGKKGNKRILGGGAHIFLWDFCYNQTSIQKI